VIQNKGASLTITVANLNRSVFWIILNIEHFYKSQKTVKIGQSYRGLVKYRLPPSQNRSAICVVGRSSCSALYPIKTWLLLFYSVFTQLGSPHGRVELVFPLCMCILYIISTGGWEVGQSSCPTDDISG